MINEELKAKRKHSIKEAEEQALNAEKRLQEAKLKLTQAKRRVKKRMADEKRNRDKRLKLHAGGLLDMTGLLRYQFHDEAVRDNHQDALIANLLVGKFLEAVIELGRNDFDELKRLYIKGKSFRDTPKAKRELPEVNPYIKELSKVVKKLIDEQNDNDKASKNDNPVEIQSN